MWDGQELVRPGQTRSVSLDQALRDRLVSVGLDPEDPGDPAAAWRRLSDRFGERITLVDRYALEAATRGIDPAALGPDLRRMLWDEVAAVRFPGHEILDASGERGDPIEVVPYNPAWAAAFSAWRSRLLAAMGPAAGRIDHVGSTAVPGLAAKPIVDIQVSVSDIDYESSYVAAIESCELEFRSREPVHRYFRPPAGKPRAVHVHVCGLGSEWERVHILFRDFVRAEPVVRRAYAELKVGLVERYRDDRYAYTDAKSGFILDALEQAESWATHTRWRLPAPLPAGR